MKKSLEEQRQELQEENKKKYCFNKAFSTVEKSIKTTMIGAIYDLEEIFGDLWGHGKDIRDKNEEELENYEDFKKIRESILDRGNTAIKICRKELKRCEISDYDNRPYKYTFKTGE